MSVNNFLESKCKTIVDHYIKLNSAEICIFYRTVRNKEDNDKNDDKHNDKNEWENDDKK